MINVINVLYVFSWRKSKIRITCERFLQQMEMSRAFLPPVSHEEKWGKLFCAHYHLAQCLLITTLIGAGIPAHPTQHYSSLHPSIYLTL